ncbi:MAG: AbiV family abortive infection protein [Thaumarchaeota archaeon]|nr:AbiV family abortive infection protein [Nitrososphaerota archaeon]
MGGDEGEAVIPLGETDGALDGLLAHIRMTQKASKWLDRGEHLAVSVYFSILCLEEIAKYCVIADCKSEGRGVFREDMGSIGTHEERIRVFWERVAAGSGTRPDPGASAGRNVATALSGAKEAAVYFGFARGAADTLEGRLGAHGLAEMSGLLKSLAAQGIQAMRLRADARKSTRHAGLLDLQASMRADMSRIMEIAVAPERTAHQKDDVVIPLDHLDLALESLEDHIAVLDRTAHRLYKKRHDAASIFLSVISLEECAKHYLLAKSRRQKRAVLGRDLRALRTHKTKLSVFFKDVSLFLGDRNRTNDPNTYAMINPKAFLKLNGLKELAIYFNHAGGVTMTLRGLFDRATPNFSHYLRRTAQGLASWMIICDGDSENPYRRHNMRDVHLRRYQLFTEFMTGPKRREIDGMYYVIGQLDRLNSALRRHDAQTRQDALAKVKKHIRP